jgi:hypothetical protein
MSNIQREYLVNIISAATVFLLGTVVTYDAYLRSPQTNTNVWAIYGGVTIFAGIIFIGQCVLAVFNWTAASPQRPKRN